jgi:aminoglycoside phosphotransferase (APT) family kinase protein
MTLAEHAVAGLDVEAVAGWLVGLGVGARPPLRFSRLGSGHSNLTFLVTDVHDRRWVLRRPPLGDLVASAHDVAREYRILSALGATAVPAPRVVALCRDDRVSDVPLVLMEHVDGIVVDDRAAGGALTPGRRRALGSTLVEALARVHAVDVERAGLASLASHAPYAERQLKRWRRQWQLSRTRELPAVDELADRLSAAVPEQQEVRIVHGDFHLGNVIVSPMDVSVRAIVDWELCTLGDPLADVGGLLAYWPRPGEPAIAGLNAPTLSGFPSREELAASYAQCTGRCVDALGFWHVLALWKVAIIVEGVMRRAQDEPRNASRGAALSAGTVDDLIARALRVTDAEGL